MERDEDWNGRWEERTKALRKESGNEISSDPLVSFLYELMRDYLPCGKVEEIMINSLDGKECLFTNGYLARYAKNIAKKLR